MKEKTHKKSLVEFDYNMSYKIKEFFRKFSKKNKKQNIVNQNNAVEPNNLRAENRFIKDIKVPEKKINLKLQEIKRDFEAGKIIEEDLCEQEIKELTTFYLQQIEEKKQAIENNRKKIAKIKAQLL